MIRRTPRSTRTDTLFPDTTLFRSSTAMRDDQVVEIMVNPDGALRLDRLGEGRIDTSVRMAPDQVERIIRLVASHVRADVHGEHPIISAELPQHIGESAGERFEGALPPVTNATFFSLRNQDQRPSHVDVYSRSISTSVCRRGADEDS